MSTFYIKKKKKVEYFEKWVSMSAQIGDVLNMTLTAYFDMERKDEKVKYLEKVKRD